MISKRFVFSFALLFLGSIELQASKNPAPAADAWSLNDQARPASPGPVATTGRILAALREPLHNPLYVASSVNEEFGYRKQESLRPSAKPTLFVDYLIALLRRPKLQSRLYITFKSSWKWWMAREGLLSASEVAVLDYLTPLNLSLLNGCYRSYRQSLWGQMNLMVLLYELCFSVSQNTYAFSDIVLEMLQEYTGKISLSHLDAAEALVSIPLKAIVEGAGEQYQFICGDLQWPDCRTLEGISANRRAYVASYLQYCAPVVSYIDFHRHRLLADDFLQLHFVSEVSPLEGDPTVESEAGHLLPTSLEVFQDCFDSELNPEAELYEFFYTHDLKSLGFRYEGPVFEREGWVYTPHLLSSFDQMFLRRLYPLLSVVRRQPWQESAETFEGRVALLAMIYDDHYHDADAGPPDLYLEAVHDFVQSLPNGPSQEALLIVESLVLLPLKFHIECAEQEVGPYGLDALSLQVIRDFVNMFGIYRERSQGILSYLAFHLSHENSRAFLNASCDAWRRQMYQRLFLGSDEHVKLSFSHDVGSLR